MLSLVSCEPTGSSFSTPGFTPDLLPVLLPIPDLTQSHSIALIQGELLMVSTKHRSRSHSITISTDRPFKARTHQESLARNFIGSSEAHVKRETICL